MPDYRVQLDTYSGPTDLLLYLIRREEVDIYDIPIARILGQYLEYVRLLEALDPDAAGDFLVLAATLMEIKSRMLLPTPPPEVDEDDTFDPRADLVRQLLAYRAFREAALDLADRAEVRSRRFSRPRLDVPDGDGQVDIEDVQIWDLLTAFNKLLASVGLERATHEVIYDDTPVALHAADILDLLERDGPAMPFEKIFEGRSRSEMIGLFLALLELIRQARVRVEQVSQFGPIVIHLLDATPITDVMMTTDRAGSADMEADEDTEAPSEEEEAVGEGAVEDVFEDEEEEFRRRIDAVQIGEVDLGRSMGNEPPGEAEEDAVQAAEDVVETADEVVREAAGQKPEGDGP